MAIDTYPDEEYTYIPDAADEDGVDGNAPINPETEPDNDPSVDVPDGPEVAGAVEEEPPAEDDSYFETGVMGPEVQRDPFPIYQSASSNAIPLSDSSAAQEALDETGEIYAADIAAPADADWDAVEDSALDQLPPADDFETEIHGLSSEEAVDEAVPVQYEIQGRSSVAAWHTLAVIAADSMSTEVAGLPTDEGWTFRIRAIWSDGVVGDWSAETSVDLPRDLLAPPVPSAPTLIADRGLITVNWDGTNVGGAAQDPDYKHTAVWVSTSGEVGTWTIAGLLFADGGSLPYTFADYNVPYFFSLSSRDLVGNESARSASASVTLKPMVEDLEFQELIEDWDTKWDGAITDAEQLSEKLRLAELDIDANTDTMASLKDVELPALDKKLSDARLELSAADEELDSRLDSAFIKIGETDSRVNDAIRQSPSLFEWTADYKPGSSVTQTKTDSEISYTGSDVGGGTYYNRVVSFSKPLSNNRAYRILAIVSNQGTANAELQAGFYYSNSNGAYQASLWPSDSRTSIPAGASRVTAASTPVVSFPEGASQVSVAWYFNGLQPMTVHDVKVVDVTDIVSAQATAENALTMAGSKSRAFYSTADPTGVGSRGDIWRKVDDNKNVIAEWFWGAANKWESSLVTSQMISNLDVGKLTAGSAVISDAVISKLWAEVITARKIQAGQVLIGSGDNLVPWFQNGPTASRTADGFYNYSQPSNPVGVINTGGVTNGGYVQTKTNGLAAGELVMAWGSGLADGAYGWGVEPGESLFASAYVRNGAEVNTRLRIYFYTSTGGYISSVGGAYVAVDNSAWLKLSVDATVPNTASYARVYTQFVNTPPAGDVWHKLDFPTLYRKKGADLIVDGAVAARHIDSLSVSAEVAKFINLDVSRLVSSTASISEAVINKLWTDVVHSRKITTEMLAVGNFDNVIPNPNFEDAGAGWDNGTTKGVNGQHVSYGMEGDAGYVEVAAAAALRGAYSDWVTARPGDEYRFISNVRFMDRLNAITASVTPYIRWVNAAGSASSVNLGNQSVTASGGLVGQFAANWTVPSGAVKIRFGLWVQSSNGDRIRFSQPQVSRVAGATLIGDGAVITEKLAADAVQAKHIATNAVTADKVHATAIDGKVITGPTIRTNSAGTGIIINNSGIEAKSSAGRQFFLDAVTGQMDARGTITTGSDSTYRAKLSNRDGIAALDIYSAGGDAAHHAALISWDQSIALRRYTTNSAYGAELAMTPTFTRLQNSDAGANLSLSGAATTLNSQFTSRLYLNNARALLEAESGSKLDLTASRVDLAHSNSSSAILSSFLYNGAMHFVSPMIEATTTTGGANINVNAGYIRKVTSASKYKLFPQAFDETLDDKLLSVDAKHWIDKVEAEETVELMCPETEDEATDPNHIDVPAPNPTRRIPGVIAEEVRDAGLDQFVIYDDQGEVEGVMYDRLGVALIPVVRRQRDRITAQDAKIADLEVKLEALTARVDAMAAA